MATAPTGRPLPVSVIVTVFNEQKHVGDLLDSLTVQEPPLEVVVVDAGSTDRTLERVDAYRRRWDAVRLVEEPGRRGHCRNVGAEKATGAAFAFIDGDCIANPFWLQRLRQAATRAPIAAGRTIQMGYWAFENLHRVELEHRGQDVTHPSCNLLYERGVFRSIGGFDDRFVTAEDIDLNLRAVSTGARLEYAPEAIVYHRARDSFEGFVRQAYWNGYGRKQLTLKHGRLWRSYSFRQMFKQQLSFWGIVRLASAATGYLAAYVREDHDAYARRPA